MFNNRYRIAFLVSVFLALISFPFLNERFGFVKDIESLENRKMASKPVINYSYLDPYPSRYEQYYIDNFTIRNRMVKYFNLLNINWFHKSPMPDKIIVGKDRWLFNGSGELDPYQGLNRFKESELEEFKVELEYRKKYLEERGCKFYFMVAPTKPIIYSEYMPSAIFRVNNQSWGEQLNEYLDENCAVKPIDVYKLLQDKKDQELLYFKLDNHWNQLGAFYCAEEFFRRLQADLPAITGPSPDDYSISKKEIRTGNIVSMMSNTGDYTDIQYELVPKTGFRAKDVKKVGYPCSAAFQYPSEYEIDKEIPGVSGPKILVISDSFGANIFPFLAEGFGRSVKIFDAWQFKLNENIVENEKPDVVLVIVLESNLRNLLKYRSTQNIKQQ